MAVARSPLAETTYPPLVGSARSARHFAWSHLLRAEREAVADDAGLLVSELAANAVLHARTDFDVVLQATTGGVRVEVRDRSELLPVFTAPSATAMSGRGLALVQSLAARWGCDVLPTGGKVVWFELDEEPRLAEADLSVEDLLAMWAGTDDVTAPGASPEVAGRPAEVVVADLPARELLAAKEHMDDVLRELQLVLLASRDGHPEPGAPGPDARVVAVARDLDAAARAFEAVRRQVREQVARAVAQGQERLTVRLQLPATGAGRAAVAYRTAVRAAEQLARSGALLTAAGDLRRHAAVRRAYLDEVIAAAPD